MNAPNECELNGFFIEIIDNYSCLNMVFAFQLKCMLCTEIINSIMYYFSKETSVHADREFN